MCGQLYPTLSFMMPHFDYILDTLEKQTAKFRIEGIVNDEADTIADGTEAGYTKLLQYFECSSDIAILATVLDPRFKLHYYSNCLEAHSKIVKRLVLELQDTIDVVYYLYYCRLKSQLWNPK